MFDFNKATSSAPPSSPPVAPQFSFSFSKPSPPNDATMQQHHQRDKNDLASHPRPQIPVSTSRVAALSPPSAANLVKEASLRENDNKKHSLNVESNADAVPATTTTAATNANANTPPKSSSSKIPAIPVFDESVSKKMKAAMGAARSTGRPPLPPKPRAKSTPASSSIAVSDPNTSSPMMPPSISTAAMDTSSGMDNNTNNSTNNNMDMAGHPSSTAILSETTSFEDLWIKTKIVDETFAQNIESLETLSQEFATLADQIDTLSYGCAVSICELAVLNSPLLRLSIEKTRKELKEFMTVRIVNHEN